MIYVCACVLFFDHIYIYIYNACACLNPTSFRKNDSHHASSSQGRSLPRCPNLDGQIVLRTGIRHRVMGFFHHQKFPETPWHSECTQTGISPTRMKAIVQVHKSSQIYTIGVNLVRSMYGTSDRPPKDVALHGTRPLLQVYN